MIFRTRAGLSLVGRNHNQSMLEVKTALEQFATEKPTVTAAEQQPSIAVLLFVNMSGDKEQEYFTMVWRKRLSTL